MNKVLSVLLSVLTLTTTNCAQGKQDMDKKTSDKKILIAYFSATGTTASVAETLADITGGELYAITPADEYTPADLDWNNKQSRSSIEMSNPKNRPLLGGKTLNVNDYDVIFLGYPIWWDLAPRIINSFIEAHDFKGKTIIPFATSGSSGISNSAEMLKKTYPESDWEQGCLLNNKDEKDIRKWVEQL